MGWLFKSAPEHNEAGLQCLGMNENEDAIKHFRKAASKEPGEPNYWWNIGIACVRHGDGEAAVAALQMHIDLGGDQAAEAGEIISQINSGSNWGSVGKFVGSVAAAMIGIGDFFE